ncbi:MAG: response regulator [Pyrinomonadaceae bacterium MAG19_C2-C3]|nr:response regulator [Pyrinomonadaceae bacterium MAG19_C2-C3]
MISNDTQRKPTILIVDDYDEYRFTIKMFLERSGYAVVEAQDGQQALDVALASLPAVILMDIGLPGFGGIAVTKELRKEKSLQNCPIIAITAYGAQGLHEEALAAGCNEVYTKPIELELLRRILERHGAFPA